MLTRRERVRLRIDGALLVSGLAQYSTGGGFTPEKSDSVGSGNSRPKLVESGMALCRCGR